VHATPAITPAVVAEPLNTENENLVKHYFKF